MAKKDNELSNISHNKDSFRDNTPTSSKVGVTIIQPGKGRYREKKTKKRNQTKDKGA